MVRASCLVCQREVWIHTQPGSYPFGEQWALGLYDLVRGGSGGRFLHTHPCWVDDEDDCRVWELKTGDLN